MSHRGSRRSLAGIVALALVGVLVGACRPSTHVPVATPADFPGVTRVLVPLGIAVSDFVSGDAGCDDQNLARTAVSFRASGLDQTAPVPLRIFIFQDDAALRRNLDAIDSCARAFITDPAQYQKLQESPYVVVGQGPWGPRFTAAIEQALREAAATGG
jgi:hypothetical protein